MGVVYEAYDAQIQSVVALKLMDSHHPSSLLRFKQEFRALADVLHPNLVSLYDLVADDGRWMFTMELVSGVNLLTFVRRHKGPPGHDATGHETSDATRLMSSEPLNTLPTAALPQGITPATEKPPIATPGEHERLRGAFLQLCDGLQAIHDRGYLHRDVKPSNVLVESSGRVAVLDFGIIEQIDRRRDGDKIVGTGAYLAPEVAARDRLTEASDWYGVGVMLFEALTGELPFIGDFKAILSAKQNRPAPRCNLLAPNADPDLAELTDGLLAMNPESRPGGREIRAVLAKHLKAAAPVARRSLFSPRFVGREREREQLSAALDEVARQRRPRCVRVHGISGMGKSALVDSFLREVAAESGALTLSGRCRPHEVLPYKALDGVVDSLAKALSSMSDNRVRELLPSDVDSAVQLFPVLATVPAIDALSSPAARAYESSSIRRRRGFAALFRLLDNVAAGKPLLLLIDDVQWGDRESARALVAGLNRDEPPPALLIVTYRSDDVRESEFLDELRALSAPSHEVAVEALDDEAALSLASACLRAQAGRPELAAEVVREAGGSPLLLAEIAAVAAVKDTVSAQDLQLSRVIADRLADLPNQARRLMEVLTVAGTRVDRRTAILAAGLAEDAHLSIKVLLAARLARQWRSSQTDALEVYHDRIRETHAALLDSELARQRHFDVALALETCEPNGVEALAVRWEAAGESERAANYYERAGDRAAETLAFDRAAEHFKRSLALAPRSGADHAAVLAKLATVLSDAGHREAAAQAFGEAAACADDAQALRYRGKQAEELIRSNRMDEGLFRLHAVLTAIGEPLPRGRGGLLASVAYQRLRIKLRGFEVARVSGGLDEATNERLELYQKTLTSLAWVDPMRAINVQGRYLREALDAGDPRHAAMALSIEAAFHAISGQPKREKSAALCASARVQARRSGDALAMSYAAYSDAFRQYHLGDYRSSRPVFAAAKAHASSLPNAHWECLKGDEGIIWCDYFLGAYAGLAARIPELYDGAVARADLPAMIVLGTGLAHAAWLVRDQVQAGLDVLDDVRSRWTDGRLHLVDYWSMFARVQTDLYEGNGAVAYQRVKASWNTLSRSGLFRVRAIERGATHTLVRAAVAAAARAPRARSSDLLRIADRAADKLASAPAVIGVGLAAAHRAAIARLQGDADRAVAELRAAIEIFERNALAGYCASAQRHLGRLLGGEEGRALVAGADSWMQSEAVAQPARFARMLLTGFED